MVVLPYDVVVARVTALIREVSCRLPRDVVDGVTSLLESETSPIACATLEEILENAGIAAEKELPTCQDTGVAVMFADLGETVRIDGSGLVDALNEATRRGYGEGGLRMSMVADPLKRTNTGDNTPAVIHTRIVPGYTLTVTFCPKGGGCENMSRLAMLTPGAGRDGVCDFVVDTVRRGGGKPCPPVIVGVGVGGTFETSALNAKRALLRDVGERSPDPYYADLERGLLERINLLGIGPMGLGGLSTAIDVFLEPAPCHIASMPVAVNIQCHAARHGRIVLTGS
jgi:fumarate hydratase subunit alpha